MQITRNRVVASWKGDRTWQPSRRRRFTVHLGATRCPEFRC